MFERLGVITNCFTKALEKGDRLEELVVSFCHEGFKEIEIRDGDYLRRSSFGSVIGGIEKTVRNYEPDVWREICEQIHSGGNWHLLVRGEDSLLMEEIDRFIKQTAGALYSYSMTYPWLGPRPDPASDDRSMFTAAGIAYLLNPAEPRLRLVSLESIEIIDHEVAVANLKRFRNIIRVFSPVFTVENALHSALKLRELALAGETLLTYDEANNYTTDGTELSSAEEFRRSVAIEELASVHLKQKSVLGVLPRLEDGYVDLRGMLEWLRDGGYDGDLLLEGKPTEQPLSDAVDSRNYLCRLFGG